MAITNNFDNRFGKALSNAGGRTNSKGEPLVPAQFWLNIGYTVEVETDTGVETRFVGLPKGIALDTVEKLPTNSSNEGFRSLRTAQNELLDQVMEFARSLKPGEDKIFGEPGGLQYQIRHVQAEQPVVKSESNPFARKLVLAA